MSCSFVAVFMFNLLDSSITLTENQHLSRLTLLKSSSLSLQSSVRLSLSLRSSFNTPMAVSIPARQAHLHRSSSVLTALTFISSRLFWPTDVAITVRTATIQSTLIRTRAFLLRLPVILFSFKLSFYILV